MISVDIVASQFSLNGHLWLPGGHCFLQGVNPVTTRQLMNGAAGIGGSLFSPDQWGLSALSPDTV
ncbi:MAG: hypothetical protein AAF384_17490 [Pseudomonadota bacterium]